MNQKSHGFDQGRLLDLRAVMISSVLAKLLFWSRLRGLAAVCSKL